MAAKSYRFESRVERLDTGLRMHVIPVPGDIAEALPETPRVLVTIGGTELRRALQARKSGQPYFSLGKEPLKELGLRLGSSVSVTIKTDPRPDQLEIAEEFIEALRQDPDAKKRWDTFTRVNSVLSTTTSIPPNAPTPAPAAPSNSRRRSARTRSTTIEQRPDQCPPVRFSCANNHSHIAASSYVLVHES